MDQDTADRDQVDEEILISTVSDEALEAAAGTEAPVVFCTMVVTGCTETTNW